MIYSLIISLLLTLIIETALALIIKIKDISTIIWVNCITNPIVVFTTNITYMISNDLVIRNIVLGILEICVVFAEGYLFKKHLKEYSKNTYLFSLYLNGLSFGIGLIINLIVGG